MKNLNKILGVGITITALGLAGLVGKSYFIADKAIVTIQETMAKRYGKHDKYLVFTDNGVFENTDAWYRGKFNSSDLQGKIMQLKGKQVEIQKYGWRVPISSKYENLVGIKELSLPREKSK